MYTECRLFLFFLFFTLKRKINRNKKTPGTRDRTPWFVTRGRELRENSLPFRSRDNQLNDNYYYNYYYRYYTATAFFSFSFSFILLFLSFVEFQKGAQLRRYSAFFSLLFYFQPGVASHLSLSLSISFLLFERERERERRVSVCCACSMSIDLFDPMRVRTHLFLDTDTHSSLELL